jgi:hypothetical protein
VKSSRFSPDVLNVFCNVFSVRLFSSRELLCERSSEISVTNTLPHQLMF